MCDFLQDLNESQKAAVTYCDGPQLVIAGAGSGKTRVLTYKIAYLLSRGMAPYNILALTFTNKAADEMKRRIAQLTSPSVARHLYMGTFHSIFYRILRAEHSCLNYKANFTIYDESDSKSLITAIVKELQLDDNTYKAPMIKGIISMAKNHLQTIGQYLTNNYDFIRRYPKLETVCLEYDRRCRNANAMDFDDLLYNTYLLFGQHPDIRKKYAEIFQYLLVDEYQDTNYAQQRIIDQLTADNQRLCMVGDDAQSIYAFRGANIDYMLNFANNKDYRVFKLEQNYRSTQNIVSAANSLINHNKRQIFKNVYSKNGEGSKLMLIPTYSDDEEANVVCNEIRRLKNKEHCQYDDFCIMYRTNAQSRKFEKELLNHSIPYHIFSGLGFYQRKEIKDIIAYFRVIANPDDEEAIKRIINYPARGIGKTTITKLIDASRTSQVSLWQIIESPERFNVSINKGTTGKLHGFYSLISEFQNRMSMDAFEQGEYILEKSGILTEIYSNTSSAEDLVRRENVEELRSALKEFVENKHEEGNDNVTLNDFLHEISLMSDMDEKGGDDVHKVSLMTVHAAKGLEFKNVFIVGLEENIFPSSRSSNSPREIEEERRLFYVAITRAKQHCILTCARSRYIYGNMEFGNPSRFIYEIDPKYLTVSGNMPFLNKSLNHLRPESPAIDSPRKPAGLTPMRNITMNDRSKLQTTNSVSTPSSSGLREGTVIEHQRFGIGTVIRIEGSNENSKATVTFNNVGTKQLLLKFAKYKIIKE